MTAPDIVVVRGAPDDDELAALVLALLMTRAPGPEASRTSVSVAWVRDTYQPPTSWAA